MGISCVFLFGYHGISSTFINNPFLLVKFPQGMTKKIIFGTFSARRKLWRSGDSTERNGCDMKMIGVISSGRMQDVKLGC